MDVLVVEIRRRNERSLRRVVSETRQCLAKNVDDEVDLRLVDDERRRNDGHVARRLEVEPVVEQLLLQNVPALAGSARLP